MRRSRRSAAVLSALAVAALAAATVGLSGATFATRTGDVHLTAVAGTLELQSSRDGQAVVANAAGMRPGESRSGLVTVSHLGSVAATSQFDVLGDLVDVPGAPRLSDVLEVALDRCTSASSSCPGATPAIPAGQTLSQLSVAPAQALGASAPGSQRTYRLTLTWPAALDDPDLQGASAQATVAFTLVAGS